jgi:Domain of unknown function (DUF6089)
MACVVIKILFQCFYFNKNTRMKFLFAYTYILFPYFLFSQSFSVDKFQHFAEHNIELGGAVGIMMYQGDLVGEFLDIKTARPCFGGFARYVVSTKFSMRGSIFTGHIVGDDANYITKQSRGYSVTTRLNELHLVGEWYPWGKSMFDGRDIFEKVVSPYVMAGFNLALADPQPKYNNVFLPKEQAAATSFAGGIAGVGAYYHLNDRLSIGVEGGLRYVFSDMLDGFSARTNPTNNDTYFVGNMNIAYRFN